MESAIRTLAWRGKWTTVAVLAAAMLSGRHSSVRTAGDGTHAGGHRPRKPALRDARTGRFIAALRRREDRRDSDPRPRHRQPTAKPLHGGIGDGSRHRSDTDGERGLLGRAFHPDYRTNGRLFINSTDAAGTTRIREFRRQTVDVVDAASGHAAGMLRRQHAPHDDGRHQARVPVAMTAGDKIEYLR
jgi:hypothetical protein